MAEERQKKKGGCLKWAAIIIGVLILFGACAAAFSGGEEETGNTSNDSNASNSAETTTEETAEESTEEETEEDISEAVEEETETTDENLAVGDSTEIDGITFTLNEAYYTDERNEFAEVEADNVLVLDMTYENNSGEDISVGGDVSVYADGTKLESYPIDEMLMDSLSDGRNISGKEGFAVVGEPSEIEVEFSPLMSFSGEKAIYTVNPE
ncbi:DUF5067 domain-containing protein [Salinicoccus luteus]|uniref:DUF5067 domain-containing protein n=1 Tax=Salinicoccus luteus TaxID=367840 RepID=UPI0004E0F269|nr:DUF5067 domain-containing protein [Salinicoccus luteus]